MNGKLKAAFYLLMTLGVACAAAPAMADTTYLFTGDPFDELAQSPFAATDYVTGWVTLSSPLADNLSYERVTPVAFSFYDTAQTLDTSDADSASYFYFSTNASGDITDWSVYVEQNNASFFQFIYLAFNESIPAYDYEWALYWNYSDNVTTNAYSTRFGAWTVAPEPPAVTLVGLGVLVLGAVSMLRRRTASVRA